MTLREEVIQTAENIARGFLKNITISTDEPSVVTGISNGKYKVNINGNDYWVKDGIGLGLTVGMGVWVHVPNGKLGNAYVCAKR